MGPMEQNIPNPGLDRPATYQIRVEGHLDERWSDWFEGMTLTCRVRSVPANPTILTGPRDGSIRTVLRVLVWELPSCSTGNHIS